MPSGQIVGLTLGVSSDPRRRLPVALGHAARWRRRARWDRGGVARPVVTRAGAFSQSVLAEVNAHRNDGTDH